MYCCSPEQKLTFYVKKYIHSIVKTRHIKTCMELKKLIYINNLFTGNLIEVLKLTPLSVGKSLCKFCVLILVTCALSFETIN